MIELLVCVFALLFYIGIGGACAALLELPDDTQGDMVAMALLWPMALAFHAGLRSFKTGYNMASQLRKTTQAPMLASPENKERKYPLMVK